MLILTVNGKWRVKILMPKLILFFCLSKIVSSVCQTELQLRGDIEDKLKIIFLIPQRKHIL